MYDDNHLEAPLLLLVTGHKNSGKNTFVDEFIRLAEDTYTTRVFSHATPIKRMLAELLFDGDMDKLEELKNRPDITIHGKSVRNMLQTLGTEWGRNCVSESIWLDRLGMEIDSYITTVDPENGPPIIIVDDARFENEVEYLTSTFPEVDSAVVGISAANRLDIKDAHDSEKDIQKLIDGAEYIIYNDGSYDDFMDSINGLYEAMFDERDQ